LKALKRREIRSSANRRAQYRNNRRDIRDEVSSVEFARKTLLDNHR
jgi:hypothetical protein